MTIQTAADGTKTARIRGSAKRKTVQGRGDYRPLDVTVYGHFEVSINTIWWLVSSNLLLQAMTLESLLQHLPPNISSLRPTPAAGSGITAVSQFCHRMSEAMWLP